eukprot:GGOE01022437.1.p1 GENE.GGOE01022437.1~~GGOE01022437.1.p1  ORF type:complete len:161 (-),score=37.96 GGOE01022437.1:400-882(-)
MGCCQGRLEGPLSPQQVEGLRSLLGRIPRCYAIDAIDKVLLFPAAGDYAHHFDGCGVYEILSSPGSLDRSFVSQAYKSLEQLSSTLRLSDDSRVAGIHVKSAGDLLSIFLLPISQHLLAVSVAGLAPHDVLGLDTGEAQGQLADVVRLIDRLLSASPLSL